jgi:hypothetical protein
VLLAGLGLAVLLAAAACSDTPTSPGPPGPPPGPPPPSPNTAPVIESIAASVERVEVNVPVTFTATVLDQETPVENLRFEWEAETGTVDGTGASVTWVLPKGAATPVDCKVTLRVIEPYLGLDTGGNVADFEHRISSVSPLVRVHDSPAELEKLTLAFLDDFADSDVDAEEAVRHFSDSCPGKFSEYRDIERNRDLVEIESARYNVTSITINADYTSATVRAYCRFHDRALATNREQIAEGECTLTAIYQKFRWWLCESHFIGTTTPVNPSPGPAPKPAPTSTSIGRLGRHW